MFSTYHPDIEGLSVECTNLTDVSAICNIINQDI